MRRVVPWALLGLVVLAAGLGAALGATAPGPSRAPVLTPSQWVDGLLARTAAAGSARFSYSHVSTSTSIAYAGRIVGSGEIDFPSGRVQATELDRQTEFTSSAGGPTHAELTAIRIDFVGIGTAMYQSIEPVGLTVFPWTKLSWHRNPRQELGLTFVGNAAVALDELRGAWHVVGVRALGAATVGGVATTRYELSTAPVCTPLHPSPLAETQGPSFVWVDVQGRLVQITGSVRLSGTSAPVTTTDTLRLSAFGVPVRIEAPPGPLTHNGSGALIISHVSCRS